MSGCDRMRTCSVRGVGDDGEALAGMAVGDYHLLDTFPSAFPFCSCAHGLFLFFQQILR